MRFLCILLLVAAALGASHHDLTNEEILELQRRPSSSPWTASPQIWPHPAKFESGAQTFLVNPSLDFDISKTSDDLVQAIKRFNSRTFQHRVAKKETKNMISLVRVEVQEPLAEVQLETDESYRLDISSNEVTIQAATQLGVFHALETFSQLVLFDFDSQTYSVNNGPWKIEDFPRFKHREVLIDSSRHFLSVSTVKKLIDALPYLKINVVHWHLVDHESFPIPIQARPLMQKLGAYSPAEKYSREDLEDIVEFARQRGVRIIPEMDMPGHASSFCKGVPEICPSETCLSPLNPARNLTFEVIEQIISEMSSKKNGLFFDNYVHLGGDEVDANCWNSVKEIAEWMKAKNMTTDDTFHYFIERAHEIGRSLEKNVIGWEEVFLSLGTKLAKSSIVQVWLNKDTVKQVVEAGYKAIYSPVNFWYLDYQNFNSSQMYQLDPCEGIADDVCKNLVLGGGGEAWGERIDASDFQSTIFPRLAAIAERLWSPQEINNYEAALPRLISFRCLLNRRGVEAAPVNNKVARDQPPMSGSCYDQ